MPSPVPPPAAPLLVLTNAGAGSVHDHAVSAALEVFEAEAKVELVATSSPDECRDALAARPGHRPVVLGGDGSVNVAVNALHRLGTLGEATLGLVPLGTGNDLARTLGLPFDPTEAARVVLHGTVRPMELLVDDQGDAVVNAVHLGIGAQAAESAMRWKRRMGMAAYKIGGVTAGLRHPGWRLTVEADGRTLVRPGRRTLMVGLGLGQSIGGGTRLAPDASPHDGQADVVVSTATGPVARLGYALRLRRGAHGERPDVVTTRARVVTVRGEPFHVNADGEVSGPVTERTWRALADGWRLTTPR